MVSIIKTSVKHRLVIQLKAMMIALNCTLVFSLTGDHWVFVFLCDVTAWHRQGRIAADKSYSYKPKRFQNRHGNRFHSINDCLSCLWIPLSMKTAGKTELNKEKTKKKMTKKKHFSILFNFCMGPEGLMGDDSSFPNINSTSPLPATWG